jgi:hypothetical protein
MFFSILLMVYGLLTIEAWAIPMTMLWPKPLMACIKLKRFIANPGKTVKPWSWRHWPGSIGLIIAGCWNRSATFHRQRLKQGIINN